MRSILTLKNANSIVIQHAKDVVLSILVFVHLVERDISYLQMEVVILALWVATPATIKIPALNQQMDSF